MSERDIEKLRNEDNTEQELVYRSAEEHPDVHGSPEIDIKERQKEYPTAVEEIMNRGDNAGVDRKSFLTLMGASISMAGLSCFKEPAEKILPYVVRQPETQPGLATYYATSRVATEGITAMLVKTREGRPIKLEGLKAHPSRTGAMSADDFATIWDLYDPNRIKEPIKKNGNTNQEIPWEAATKEIKQHLKGSVRVLGRTSYSPSEKKAIQLFLKSVTNSKIVRYDPIGDQQELLESNEQSYGLSIIPDYKIDKAKLIVAIECDFLGSYLQPAYFTKKFSKGRNVKKMNRLITIESMMTLTGANADERIPLNGGASLAFAMALANELLAGSSLASNGAIKAALADFTAERVSKSTGVDAKVVKKLAKELKKHKGQSLVLAGGAATRTSQGKVQIVANLINSILKNEGETIDYGAPIRADNDISTTKDLIKLVNEMNNGKVDTLIIDRANPVFDLPESLKFNEALSKVATVIVLTEANNETSNSKESNFILPVSHFLEAWSDGISLGSYAITQPVIRPLFGSKNIGDIWLELAGNNDSFYSLVRKTAAGYAKGKEGWHKLIARGYSKRKTKAVGAPKFKATALDKINPKLNLSADFRLSLFKNICIGDGSGANNSNRQELPDPITKITWENVLAVSPVDANAKKWSHGDILKLTAGSRTIEAPVFIQPGLRQKSMALAIGYGHDAMGDIANGKGKNAMQIAHVKNSGFIYSGIKVKVEKTGEKDELASTQLHHDISTQVFDKGDQNMLISMHTSRVNEIARSGSLADYKKDAKLVNPPDKLPGKGLYTKYEYKTHRWAMNIDLNACTGCSACVTSCSSENNIPMVGKKEIATGREMSWMRIDRYYKGSDLENPDVLFQPMLCQHCENAPCENVCPVGATSHSSEGLNDMSYNRCIGTRYCANNCPYKVRRFNFFENWEGIIKDPQQLAFNPDVTVRSRGVIEKCSFCVQRINQARQEAHVNGQDRIADGDLETACQQGCPANAISFGDINDSNSKIAKLEKDDRSYRVLLQTNVQPMITYRVRIKNRS